MKTGLFAIAIGALASSAVAQNPTLKLDWTVNGQDDIAVQPGEDVLVVGTMGWIEDSLGLAEGKFDVRLDGADLTDGLLYAEALMLGRNPILRLYPQTLIDSLGAGYREITGSKGEPVHVAQWPPAINAGFDPSNPIEVFRFHLTAGDAGRLITVTSTAASGALYNSPNGPAEPAGVVVDDATIQVVPAPGTMALAAIGGVLACGRRRRG